MLENRQTLVDVSLGLWERPAMAASMAFLRYMRDLSQARATLSDHHVFVAVVDAGGEPNRTTSLGPGETILIGRHSNCDLQLDHADVALRQLAVHVSQSSTGQSPIVRVWDLHTGETLVCEDGAKVEALAADGPIFVSLGRYHLAIVPLGQLPKTLPVSTNAAWAALPNREFVASVAEGTGSRLLPQGMGGPVGTTSVTRLPSSVGLEELVSTPVEPTFSVARLTVQGKKKRHEFNVGIEHLERGILIGRYGRCVGRGLDPTVSRVHMLLTCVAGEVLAIDTASTVGCQVGNERFSTRHLAGSIKIWLGKHSYLLWEPRSVPGS